MVLDWALDAGAGGSAGDCGGYLGHPGAWPWVYRPRHGLGDVAAAVARVPCRRRANFLIIRHGTTRSMLEICAL